METQTIHLTLNGIPHTFHVLPTQTLLDVIRDLAGLTGTKRGCDNGHCGACTVILNGRAVNSCCLLAVQADGGEVETVETFSRHPGVHPIPQAFVDAKAIQCGYCIPGMEMSTKALLDRNSNPSDTEIQEALAGNVCRCTGYTKIQQAVRMAAQAIKKGGENP